MEWSKSNESKKSKIIYKSGIHPSNIEISNLSVKIYVRAKICKFKYQESIIWIQKFIDNIEIFSH